VWSRRLLGQLDVAGTAVSATRGIAAGSAFATSELKLYLLPVLATAQQRPWADKLVHNVFVDDILMMSSHSSFEQCLDVAVAEYRALVADLHAVQLSVVSDKTDTIATSET
jgi:hypothetical protein